MTSQTVPLFVPADHPAYDGHFPGQPILPGVVLLDAALHVLAERQDGPGKLGSAQLKSAKFLSPVRPGEPLTLHYADSPTGGVRFEIRCGERSVASGAVAFAPERAA